jgi:hypothetical protein
MRKLPLTAALLVAFAVSLAAQEAPGASASTDVSLLNIGNLENYSKSFLNGNGSSIASKYIRVASDEDFEKIAPIGGNATRVDTPLEIALLSTCAGVVDVRPIEAQNMLPANPRTADLKLGAAVYMDMQAAKFLGSDPAPHAAALKFITDRGRVTEADIKKFMTQGIANAVDAEFNKVVFMVDRKYNVVLTHNPKIGQFTLNYERPSVENDDKELTASSLEALSSAMSRSGDFSATAFNTVREQAALIPAAALGSRSLDDIKIILTNFYTNPNTNTYAAVRDVYTLFTVKGGAHPALENSSHGYANTLAALNTALSKKVITDANQLWVVTAFTVAQQQRLTNNLQ